MNIKILKEKNYIIYETITGSTAYHLNLPESDVDKCGIFMIPKEDHLSLFEPVREVGDDRQDLKYYELKKFFRLAADCNPNIIELLFYPQDCIQVCKPIMQKIIDNRSIFISKKAYYTFTGYAHAQIKKAKGQNKLINNPKPETPPNKNDFCWVVPYFNFGQKTSNCAFSLDVYLKKTPLRPMPLVDAGLDLDRCHVAAMERMSNAYRLYWYGDEAKGVFRGKKENQMLVTESIPLEHEEQCIGLLIYNQHEYEKSLKEWRQYWEWVKNRNKARWVSQEKGEMQFDGKNIMHTFRLLFSGKNILNTGEPIIRFEGEQREFLLDIRKGKYEYDFLMDKVQSEMEEIDKLKETSNIPHSVDMNTINNLYMEIIEQS
jgi:uncharacterized protein